MHHPFDVGRLHGNGGLELALVEDLPDGGDAERADGRQARRPPGERDGSIHHRVGIHLLKQVSGALCYLSAAHVEAGMCNMLSHSKAIAAHLQSEKHSLLVPTILSFFFLS